MPLMRKGEALVPRHDSSVAPVWRRHVRTAGVCALLFAAVLATPAVAADTQRWVGTWAASQQTVEPANLPPAPGFTDTTVRQVVRVSIGGSRLRLRFSNEFGRTDLTLLAARVARFA